MVGLDVCPADRGFGGKRVIFAGVSTKGSSPSRSKIKSGSDVPMMFMPNSTFPHATAGRPSNGGPGRHSMQRAHASAD